MGNGRIKFLEEQIRWHREEIKTARTNLQSLETAVALLGIELRRLQKNAREDKLND